MIYLLVMMKVSLVCHQYFITKISTTFPVNGVRLHPYLRPLTQSSLCKCHLKSSMRQQRYHNLHFFGEWKSSNFSAPTHFNVQFKVCDSLVRSGLDNTMVTKDDRRTCRSPTIQYGSNNSYQKQLLLQSETKNMTWKNNNKIICEAKIRVPKEGMKQYQNLHKVLKKQVWSINPLSDCGR